MVLTELLNHFAGYGASYRTKLAVFVKSTRDHPNVTVISQSSSQFEGALDKYEQY